jgi:glutaconate CoA-transferase subunit B
LCKQVYIVMMQTPRAFVERVDFITSFGHGTGGDHRQRLGIRTAGPTLLVSDLCLMRPDPVTKEWVVTSLHPGVTRDAVQRQTGWPIRFAGALEETPGPNAADLAVLRDLQARTTRAHSKENARHG